MYVLLPHTKLYTAPFLGLIMSQKGPSQKRLDSVLNREITRWFLEAQNNEPYNGKHSLEIYRFLFSLFESLFFKPVINFPRMYL